MKNKVLFILAPILLILGSLCISYGFGKKWQMMCAVGGILLYFAGICRGKEDL